MAIGLLGFSPLQSLRIARETLGERAWRNFLFDASSAALGGIFLGAVLNFAQVVARREGAPLVLISLLVAGPFIGSILALAASYVSRGQDPLPWFIRLHLLGRVPFLLMPFAITPEVFVALVLTFYIVVFLVQPLYVDIMNTIYPQAYRGRLMGYVRVILMGIATLVTPLAGRLLDTVSFGPVFLAGGLIGMGGILLFSGVRPLSSAGRPRFGLRDVWIPLRDDALFRNFVLGSQLWGLGFNMVTPLFPVVQVDRLGLSYTQMGLLGLITSACWALAFIFWGRYTDARGGLQAARLTVVIMVSIPVLYGLANSFWPLAVAAIFMGAVNAGAELSWYAAIIQLAGIQKIIPYATVHSVLSGVRGMIAPFLPVGISAVLGDTQGTNATFLIGTVFIIVSAVALTGVVRQQEAR
jgi:hypothetical protein